MNPANLAAGEPPGLAADWPAGCAGDAGLVLPAVLARRAAENPDDPFLAEVAGPSMSYQQTWQEVRRWLAALAQLGVRPGEAVASFLPQSADAQLLWLANALLGARHVPVNPQLRGEFLRHVLRDAGVRRAFARADQVAGLLEAGLPSGIELIESGPAPARWGHLLAAVAPAAEPALPAAGDVATVIYTSGTTGPAKGVLVTWGQIANSVGLRPARLLGPGDAYYTPWPPFHVMGLTPLAVMAAAGGRVVVRNGPSISGFWADIDRYGCTCATIGPIARLIMNQASRPDDHSHALRSVIMGPVIPDVDEFRARFGIDVMTVYGSSEIAYPLVTRHVNASNRHLLTELRPGYAARIVDGSLQDVPDGTLGELLVRPPDPCLATPGYLGQPELTAQAWAGSYFRTGDAFIRHPDGTFEFRDRLKDTIRRFGENISSTALEAAVMGAEGVLECAAVGIPDEISGQAIHLAVVPASGAGLDPAALMAQLRGILPRFMLPAVISIWPQLPKTPNGKIRKEQVRAAGVPDGAWRDGTRSGHRA
jgi:crotonobetaine/carnitine-CoA ligase